MDKDMIHIDDLVRGQLSEREEEERAGAWLRMRELLDKEMPAGTPAPYNRRRLGGYLALFSLLAVMATGGYIALQYPSNSEEQQLNAATNPITTYADQSVSTVRDSEDMVEELPLNAAAKNSDAQQYSSEDGANNNNPPAASASGHSSSALAVISDNETVPNTDPQYSSDDHQRPLVQADNQSSDAPSRPAIAADKLATTQSVTTSQRDAQASHSLEPAEKKLLTTQSPAVPGPNTSELESVAAPGMAKASSPSMTSGTIATATLASKLTTAATTSRTAGGDAANEGQTTSAATKAEVKATSAGSTNEQIIARRDTIQQINLVYRTVVDPVTRTKTRVVDTTSVKNIIIDQPDRPENFLLAAETPKQPAPSIVPAATVSGETQSAVSPDEAVVNAQSKKEIKKNARTFQDMYLDAKYRVAEAPFYIGLHVGVNGMSSKGTFLPGFHFGMNGELELSERWSVMAELKYINRFSNGKTIEDPYRGSATPIREYYINSVPYKVFESDSLNHYFNFSTIGTGNLPIMVKYSVNKFFLLAGVDFVYHFRMNAEEIDAPINGAQIRDTLPSFQSPPILANGGPSVQLNDLGGQFGIGYLLGVGYKASPNLHLDLRMSHTFWDNARTGGAKKVSEQLFRIPTMQLTLGYRLGGRQAAP